MRTHRTALSWRTPFVLVVAAFIVLIGALPAQASGSRYDYLALGDSVAFGYNPLLNGNNPANFVGYPSVALAELNQVQPPKGTLTNAACPGETTSHFISLSGADLSCGAYRAKFPLHVQYSSSQLDYAIAFLKSHPSTRLVTIDLGVNDLGLLEQKCAMVPACIIQGLPATLATIAANFTTIYTRIRHDAHYQYRIVALEYYVTNYNDTLQVTGATAGNKVIASTVVAAGGAAADGFKAFKLASASTGGDACAAGLLIQLSASPLTCDIHPSPKGRDILGTWVDNAVDSLEK